jgi:hypothetical protein
VLIEGSRVDSSRNPPIRLDHLNLNAYIDAMYIMVNIRKRQNFISINRINI